MKDVTKIIQSIVDDIDNSIVGEFDALEQKTFVCKTKWLRVGQKVVSIDGEFIVTEIKRDEWIVAVPVGHLNDLNGLFYIKNPFYITGTKLATNREWTIADNDLTEKLPLIWMLELISETIFGRGSSYERTINVELFFLDETDPSQYYTIDHREQVVEPMERLLVEFIETINRKREFENVDEYRIRTFSRFGTENDNGVLQNVLDANLSGLKLEFTLSKFKENCIC
jgi:hypothetical protein